MEKVIALFFVFMLICLIFLFSSFLFMVAFNLIAVCFKFQQINFLASCGAVFMLGIFANIFGKKENNI